MSLESLQAEGIIPMSDQPNCLSCKKEGTCELHKKLAAMHDAIDEFKKPPVPESWEKEFEEKFGFERNGNAYFVIETSEVPIKDFIARVRNQALEEASEEVKGTQEKYRGMDKRTKEPTYSGGGQCRECMKRRDSIEIEDVVATIRSLKK